MCPKRSLTRSLPVWRVSHDAVFADDVPWDSDTAECCEWTGPTEKAKFISVVTFGGTYLAHGNRDLGMSFHAGNDLVHALDETYTTVSEHTHDCAQLCAQVLVPPAATWMLLAASKIYQLCKQNTKRPFNMERWNAWRQKLQEIGTGTGLDSEVCSIAMKATCAMDRAALEGQIQEQCVL